VTIDWVAAPDRADVLARDVERMLADPALAAPLGNDEAPVAARLTAAYEAERLAAAYGRLWSSGRPSPETLAPGRPRRRRGAGVWFAVALAPEDLADSREVVRRLCRLGRVSRQEIRRMRILETEVQVEVSRAAAWGFATAASTGGEVRRLHGAG
jgi:ATP-dependent RNA helicase DeaD